MSNEKPGALELADIFENLAHPTGPRHRAATELLRLHAKVQVLEAMLESIGAGGVSAQRITQGKDHIEQPIEMVAAPVVLPEPVAAQYRHIKEERWRTIALVLYDLYAGDEYERRYIYTELQVRDLLAEAACTKSQTTVQEPFGYFKAEPFGWRDCADTDEGAIALYEAPQQQADALDEEREKLLRALYDRGHEDMAKERDYDQLGASEFDAAMCAPRAGAARAKQADALDAESWVSESDSKPLEADGEVFVRFSDGTFGTGWAAYWHGASNDFAQWCHPDPDEDRTVTHWMKPPTIDAAIAAAKGKP